MKSITIYLDKDAKKLGWTIVGKLPLVLQFKNGVFDAECLQVHDYRRVAAARETNIIDMFQKLEGQPFLNMLVSFQTAQEKCDADALEVVIYSQLVWRFAGLLEEQYLSACDIAPPVGKRRKREDDSSVSAVIESPCHNRTNTRATNRELQKYLVAAHEELRDAQFIAVAGPDGTKIGTDCAVSLGFFLNPVSGKVVVGVPQERVGQLQLPSFKSALEVVRCQF